MIHQVVEDSVSEDDNTQSQLAVLLSGDGGERWSEPLLSEALTTSEATSVLGGVDQTWGHDWTGKELENIAFRVRVSDLAAPDQVAFSLSWVAVKVYYALPGEEMQESGYLPGGLALTALVGVRNLTTVKRSDTASLPLEYAHAASLLTLSAAVDAQYMYDGNNNLVKSVVNGVSTYYVGRYYEKEVGTSTTVRKYYQAGSTTIAMKSDSTLYWLLSDHLGSTSLTTDASGALYSEVRFTAFGEVRYASTTGMPTDHLYTGQMRQSETGLDYFIARWFDSAIGRFLSADTIVPGVGNSQAYDRYAYLMNNPLNDTDPTGHFCSGPNCPITTPNPFSNQDPLNISPAATPSPFGSNPSNIPAPVPYVLSVAPPDFTNPLTDGNPPPPQVEGLPNDGWQWKEKWPGLGSGYQNSKDPSGSVWRPDPGTNPEKPEGEDSHWHVRQPGQSGNNRGQVFPPNPEWSRGNNNRSQPGVYNPDTGRYDPQVSPAINLAKPISIVSGSLSFGYLLYRGVRLVFSPVCGPLAGVCAFGP